MRSALGTTDEQKFLTQIHHKYTTQFQRQTVVADTLLHKGVRMYAAHTPFYTTHVYVLSVPAIVL